MVSAIAAFGLSLWQRQELQAGSAERLLDHLSSAFPDCGSSLIGRVFTRDGGYFFEGRWEVSGVGSGIEDPHCTNWLMAATAVAGVVAGVTRALPSAQSQSQSFRRPRTANDPCVVIVQRHSRGFAIERQPPSGLRGGLETCSPCHDYVDAKHRSTRRGDALISFPGHRSIIGAGVGEGSDYVDSEGGGRDVDLCHPSLLRRNRRMERRQ